MRQLWRCFVLSWQFFTIIPAPRISDPTEKEMRQSALFLPVIGLVLGGILTVVDILCAQVLPPLADAFIALTVYTLCTGALHVDGFMDMADAVGSRKPKEEALVIMKDSRVGAMGAIAAVFLLGGKWVAMGSFPSQSPAVLLLIPVLSRLAMLSAMTMAPAARPNGLGAMFARQVRLVPVISVSLATWAFAAILLPLYTLAIVFVLFYLLVLGFCGAVTRRFGGMTGDTYGALSELTEWALYFVFLATVTSTLMR